MRRREIRSEADSALASKIDERSFEQLRTQIEALHPGSRRRETRRSLRAHMSSRRSTELAKNGTRLALIAGEEFARAYFRIWLGESPLDRGLPDQLLEEQ